MLINDKVDYIDKKSLNFDRQGPDTSRQDENDVLLVPGMGTGENFSSKDSGSTKRRKSLYPVINNEDSEESDDNNTK